MTPVEFQKSKSFALKSAYALIKIAALRELVDSVGFQTIRLAVPGDSDEVEAPHDLPVSKASRSKGRS
jgi:hypothetical protein